LSEGFFEGVTTAGEGKAAQMVWNLTVEAAFKMAIKGVGIHP
jgi:hypothetical protein